MTEILLNLMAKAVQIRVSRGEELEAVLDSYPKLTDEDKEKIRGMMKE